MTKKKEMKDGDKKREGEEEKMKTNLKTKKKKTQGIRGIE